MPKSSKELILAERQRYKNMLKDRKKNARLPVEDNAEKPLKDERSSDKRYYSNRLFSNVLSAPQTASHVLRSIFGYCLIIMLVVNLVRVSSDMAPLTVSSFFEYMSQCPDFDFASARLVIENLSWDNVPGALFNSFVIPFLRLFSSIWNGVLFFCESILDCLNFVWFLLSYFFGWYVPV